MREQADLLDRMTEAIMVRDLDDRITYWNKGAERLYGWTAEEVFGRPAMEVLRSPAATLRMAEVELAKSGEWSGELGQVTRAGRPLIVESRWTRIRDAAGIPTGKVVMNIDVTEKRALELLDWLQGVGELGRVSAVGHLIVHGGPNHTDPQVVTLELIAELRDAIPFAPPHLPSGIQLIEAITHRLPGIPQVVCFDTAFHRDLLPAARTLTIPRWYRAEGIRRYGFHGMSFANILEEFERVAGVDAATLFRIVVTDPNATVGESR